MRKTGVLLLGVFFLTAGWLSAQPDPRDSVILESKTVAPNLSGSPAFTMKVYITNKDTLAILTLALRESTTTGVGYAFLDSIGPVNQDDGWTLADCLVYLKSTLNSNPAEDFSLYNGTSPDRFLVASTFSPTGANPTRRSEPPNATRSAIWELRFMGTSSSFGQIEFDTAAAGTGLAQSTLFTILRQNGQFVQDVPVNFAKSTIQVGLPLQFLLVAPPNGAVVGESRPTFIWTTLRDTLPVPATYTVFLANNPVFSPADTSPPLSDTTWQVPFDLQIQTTYYWKVRAISSGNDTVFSPEERNFRLTSPPSTPNDISPPSGADMSMFDYLVWLESTDPDPGDVVSYQVQIDDNADFSSPEVDQNGIDENTFPQQAAKALTNALAVQLSHLADHDNLKDDSLYYWRVRAQDNHGASSAYTSGQRRFFLNLADSSPRPVPGGFSPSGGIVLTTHRPDFSWFQSSDPDPDDPPSSLLYHLRLDTDGEILGNFQFNYATPPGETTLVPLDSLAENSHWFWGVRTVDSKGARSAFSAIQDFYINAINEPPAAFSLLSPSDNGFTVTRMPGLDWEDAADPDPFDAVTYEVVISPFANFDSAFTAGGISISSYTVQSGALGARGRLYYWKVRAVDASNLSTPSSQVFRFTLLKLGDANLDNQLTGSDIVLLLQFIYTLNFSLPVPEVADLNCDGNYTGADIVLALNAVFLGVEPPCDP